MSDMIDRGRLIEDIRKRREELKQELAEYTEKRHWGLVNETANQILGIEIALDIVRQPR
jgi:hypothetical protein